MSVSIVLVESHYRSRSWFLALNKIGLTHIISVMPEEFKLFIKQGFPKNNILNLYYKYEDKYIENASIDYYEKFLNIKLNAIICMDRTLRKKNSLYIKAYLSFLLIKIDSFFKKIKPKIIFIEPTWTHEILICKFAQKYNVHIVSPVKDKLLPNRFMAFKDENHLKFYKNIGSKDASILAEKAINTVIYNKPIQYFKKFNNRNKIDIQKIPKLYRLIKLSFLNYRNPNIQGSVFRDIFVKLTSIIRSQLQIIFLNFEKLNNISNKYILITLHVQPEASIDVVGTKYDNQIEFVKNIAKTTPNDYTILVKEHSHAIGNRSTCFYKNLNNLPNVILLHPNESSRDAIKNAKLVISNTGTSSLEASILNIPAITATKMFYYKLMLKECFNPIEENIGELLKKTKKINKKEIVEHIKSIYEGSFNGNCGDFQTDGTVLHEGNIENLRLSFQRIVRSIK